MSPEYETCVRTIFYHKKGKKMKNEFKAGDLVFETLINGEMLLTKLSARGDYVCTRHASYNHYGINEQAPICQLLHATPENRQALVTLYGEDAVPKLPLRGSELTRKLLKKQKYVLCWISAYSDDAARRNKALAAIRYIDDNSNLFTCIDNLSFCHAVPVDMNGNEITGTE